MEKCEGAVGILIRIKITAAPILTYIDCPKSIDMIVKGSENTH